jgi:hypothetical protein
LCDHFESLLDSDQLALAAPVRLEILGELEQRPMTMVALAE